VCEVIARLNELGIVVVGKPGTARRESRVRPAERGWPEPASICLLGAGRKLDPTAAAPSVLLMMICLAVLADSASLHKVSLPA